MVYHEWMDVALLRGKADGSDSCYINLGATFSCPSLQMDTNIDFKYTAKIAMYIRQLIQLPATTNDYGASKTKSMPWA